MRLNTVMIMCAFCFVCVFAVSLVFAQGYPSQAPSNSGSPPRAQSTPPAPKHEPATARTTESASAAPSAPPSAAPAEAAVAPVKPPPPAVTPRFLPGLAPKITVRQPYYGARLDEDSRVSIIWDTQGEVARVRLYFYYERCRLGGKSRGTHGQFIAHSIPNTGSFSWRVPWIDATAMRIRIAGLNAEDEKLCDAEFGVNFMPAVCKNVPPTSLVINKQRQRLYFLKDGKIQRMHIVSTAARGYTTPLMRPGSRDPRRGEMGKVFRKARAPFSRMYQVTMPYWLQITSSGSHGIHATTPRYYSMLGRPASHGCVRQHYNDAQVLYNIVNVGTPVYVFAG